MDSTITLKDVAEIATLQPDDSILQKLILSFVSQQKDKISKWNMNKKGAYISTMNGEAFAYSWLDANGHSSGSYYRPANGSSPEDLLVWGYNND